MKFGLLSEVQYPRPWSTESEQQLFDDVVSQIELADQLGYDHAWQVEHHFLEEYSHSSAPEIVLAAAARTTKRIRLGHGIVAMPPPINHPARVAERIATLDLVSKGRVDFGTGEAASRSELEAYGVPLELKRAMWLEATEQAANMLAMDPYPGYEGRFFSMPCRNVVPKPVQKPHPPMWMACSNRKAVQEAARLGLGALTFALIDAEAAREWVQEYYEILKSECTPIAHTVNPNIAMTVQLSVDEDDAAAFRRGNRGRLFHSVGAAHYYADGVHRPGRTDLWERFERRIEVMEETVPHVRPTAMGTPAEAREAMQAYEEIGADQVLFIAQMGRTSHEDICRSLRLMAEQVMPEFKARDPERERRKQAELAPHIEAAMARKTWMRPLADDEIPSFEAFKRNVAEAGQSQPGELEPDSWERFTGAFMRRVRRRLGEDPDASDAS